MREMAAQGIFQFKSGSKERGNIWQAIASNLNGNKDLFSYVSSRGCRDRFTLISRRYKAKTAEELKSTGGGSEDEPKKKHYKHYYYTIQAQWHHLWFRT